MIELGLKVTLAYLLGSVLGALLVGAFRGVDIRKLGSGNAGGTNALRTQGKAFAAATLAIDIGKGIVAAAVIPGLAIPGVGFDPLVDRALMLYAVAVAAIVGHIFPVWFQFRGGKGAATAVGLLTYLAPTAGLVALATWIVLVLGSGFVGLATMTAAVAAVAFLAVTRLPDQSGLVVFALVVATLLIYAHRGNIKRMLAGTESRFARPAWLRVLGGR